LLAAVGFLWLLADLADVAFGAQLALVVMLQAAITTVLGIEVARRVAFPPVFLLSAVPAGEFHIPHLIDWKADFRVRALHGC
jgi:hypothetical protein